MQQQRVWPSALAGFPVLTLDIDWAPDFVVDTVAAILVEKGVKATWLVTHESPAIARLRSRQDLFELGLHPNFLAGSTHGTDVPSIMRHCLLLVSDARVVRTHGLMQSTNLIREMFDVAPLLTADLSLYLPRAHFAEPIRYWAGKRSVLRLPHIWEDDFEMLRPDPVWQLDKISAVAGLAILDFHPIHVFMNARDFGNYERMKSRSGGLSRLNADDIPIRPLTEAGSGKFFGDVVEFLAASGRSYKISEIVNMAVGDT